MGDFIDPFSFLDGKVSETALLSFSAASPLIGLGFMNYKMFHSYDLVILKLWRLDLVIFSVLLGSSSICRPGDNCKG